MNGAGGTTHDDRLATVTSLLIDAARAWHRNPSSAGHVLALCQVASRYEEVATREERHVAS